MESIPLNLREKNYKRNVSVSSHQKVNLEKLQFLKRFSLCFPWNRVNRNDGPVKLSTDQIYSEKLKIEFNHILIRICEKLKFDINDIIGDDNFKKLFISEVSTALNLFLKGQYFNCSELHEENLILLMYGLTNQEMDNVIKSSEAEENNNKNKANTSSDEEEISAKLYPIFPLKIIKVESKNIICLLNQYKININVILLDLFDKLANKLKYKKYYVKKIKDGRKSNKEVDQQKNAIQSENSYEEEFGKQFSEFNPHSSSNESIDEIANFLEENGSHDVHMNYNSSEEEHTTISTLPKESDGKKRKWENPKESDEKKRKWENYF